MNKLIRKFIAATNAFDVETALSLFAANSVIEDVSVGTKFVGTTGVREYLETYFVGYHTVSKLMSVEMVDHHQAKAHLDFTGDFGHETGFLDVTVGPDGLIASINADLD
ncbi:MAG: nuclear transport factor 2 family protein [Devosia nanyangense]|uniref:Nuclear transport factor 2 family protein n=1 Tax=Devosia nanyangense TaxID=1228055 RepID=A0A933NW55_9HYPH|nr:nuclear transport factor 2 family protein [Devosia nanyangense]